MGAGGAYPGDLLTTSVYCPKTLPGNYLNVRLVGVKSNRSAIGARMIAGGGRPQSNTAKSPAAATSAAMPFEQHFGLAEIPTSGCGGNSLAERFAAAV